MHAIYEYKILNYNNKDYNIQINNIGSEMLKF